MPTFIDTGEEYLNAAHIISIDTIPGDRGTLPPQPKVSSGHPRSA